MTRELVCELCGRSFSCGVDDGRCWCFEAPRLAEGGAVVAAEASDCVCPTCFGALAAAGRDSDA